VARYARLGPDDSAAPRILVDAYDPEAYGGTGQRADWDAVARLAGSTGNLMLAGGLKPDNVAQAVRHVLPWGVDAASGVESEPGIKDPDAMRAFVSAAKTAVPIID
jgi:phosphoribosylanthranilate isomerase